MQLPLYVAAQLKARELHNEMLASDSAERRAVASAMR
jgi:hypothetical protein